MYCHHVLKINLHQWKSVFLEWSSGVKTGKGHVASENPEKPSISLLAHKQESALSASFGQLCQHGAAVMYSQLHQQSVPLSVINETVS